MVTWTQHEALADSMLALVPYSGVDRPRIRQEIVELLRSQHCQGCQCTEVVR